MGQVSGVASPIAKLEDHKPKLFQMYQNCRFDEIACHRLMGKYMRIETLVMWSTVIVIFISLVTDSISILTLPAFAPIWAFFNVLAFLIGLYSLLVSSSSKRFHWFSMASAFRSTANQVEIFSEYVRLGKITENELLDKWTKFSTDIQDVKIRAGMDLIAYCSKNQSALDTALENVLKKDRKL